MAQGKCNLLKPVNNLTGTFFMFSQYTQDLTKQYTQSDKYRCIPSKFAAFNLDLSKYTSKGDVELGNIFQDYFENACTFLRSKATDDDSWNPEYTRILLFQTLQKYGLMNVTDDLVKDSSGVICSGVSKQLQYIGDINLYSYEDLQDGEGFNEIYCYINNDAKCKDYQLSAATAQTAYNYDQSDICGYEDQTPYNGLSYVAKTDKSASSTSQDSSVYCIGMYGDPDLTNHALIPQVLDNHNSNYSEDSNDPVRTVNDEEPTSFPVNAIVVFYDIVNKNGSEDDRVEYYNVPLGIYFTGTPQSDGTMTNSITKYISSDEVYNQGTSYGLRICSRFLSFPNSEEKVEVETTSSSNVSAIAPLLEKMGETLESMQDVIEDQDKMYDLVKEHLALFKNNKTNVPYVRTLGTKKYWFVNGKNTGAVAEYEISDADAVVKKVLEYVMQQVYTQTQIQNILKSYVTKTEFDKADFAKKSYVDEQINNLLNKIEVYLQGE